MENLQNHIYDLCVSIYEVDWHSFFPEIIEVFKEFSIKFSESIFATYYIFKMVIHHAS